MNRAAFRTLLVAVLAGTLGAAAPAPPAAPAPAPAPPENSAPVPIARIDEIRTAHPIPPGESLTTLELLRGQDTSAHLVQVRTRLKPQIHREHEEVAYIVEGRGVFVLGERAYPVKAGSVMIIPRGMRHAYEAKEPTVVLAVFAPPFDPADRIPAEDPSP